jgi:hypothetical protein
MAGVDREIHYLGEVDDVRICLLVYYPFYVFSAEEQQSSCIPDGERVGVLRLNGMDG